MTKSSLIFCDYAKAKYILASAEGPGVARGKKKFLKNLENFFFLNFEFLLAYNTPRPPKSVHKKCYTQHIYIYIRMSCLLYRCRLAFRRFRIICSLLRCGWREKLIIQDRKTTISSSFFIR